jgi:hypothetical protein
VPSAWDNPSGHERRLPGRVTREVAQNLELPRCFAPCLFAVDDFNREKH